LRRARQRPVRRSATSLKRGPAARACVGKSARTTDGTDGRPLFLRGVVTLATNSIHPVAAAVLCYYCRTFCTVSRVRAYGRGPLLCCATRFTPSCGKLANDVGRSSRKSGRRDNQTPDGPARNPKPRVETVKPVITVEMSAGTRRFYIFIGRRRSSHVFLSTALRTL